LLTVKHGWRVPGGIFAEFDLKTSHHMKTLSHEEARSFYDHLGAKQDWQRFFEDPATDDLVKTLALRTAQSVLEFGCGTGRLAESMLTSHLPPTAEYVAIDISSNMVSLARTRLKRFGSRVRVLQSAGEMKLEIESRKHDRFISTYVFDLLSEADIAALLAEAHRALSSRGLLGLVSLTHGPTLLSHLIERAWVGVHSFRPSLVGGCRPIELLEFVEGSRWRIRHRRTITRFGMASEVVVAEKFSKSSDH
jgi:ubiquinone/menaquinone biosynthesis C-methylase UbiE